MPTNADMIAVDQKSTASREAAHSGDTIAWTADLPAGFPGGFTSALALFNTGESVASVNSSFEAYGLGGGSYAVKDAWAGKPVGKLSAVKDLAIEPHGAVLWLLRR